MLMLLQVYRVSLYWRCCEAAIVYIYIYIYYIVICNLFINIST
jgi:hypothetical protein